MNKISARALKIFNDWINKPAEEWQFWLPNSGATGGIVFGLCIISVIMGLVSLVALYG